MYTHSNTHTHAYTHTYIHTAEVVFTSNRFKDSIQGYGDSQFNPSLRGLI